MSTSKSRITQAVTLFVLAVLAGFSVWAVVGPWFPGGTVARALLFMFFICAPIGSFWMIYDCARQEKRLPMHFLLALLPYAFVWYYFDRVKPRQYRTTIERPSTTST